MKKKLIMLGVSMLMFWAIFGISKSTATEQSVVINEIRSWDVDITRTGYFGSDYIELYNMSLEPISLEGWYLSDDESDMLKSRLSDITIEAKGYVLIFANGKADTGDSVNFKINPEGEKIFLSNAEGKLVDSIFIPKQEVGTVYARKTDGGKEWTIQEASYLTSNNEKKELPTRNLAEPEFSHKSGFYSEAFQLIITAGKGETIYYTLDGTLPTKESLVYEDGIFIENKSDEQNVINAVRNIRPDWKGYGPDMTPVDKAVIVRAVSIDKNNNASNVVTNSYFVDLDKYKSENVISIVSEYKELFGEQGIFVTGKEYDDAYLAGTSDENIEPNIYKSGRRWEARGNIQILENGVETINQGIGIRIQGASSRNGKKKRMSIFAREEYSGNQYLNGLVFEDGNQSHSIMTMIEKTSGILQGLVSDRAIATQSTMKATIFLNGEYYYPGYTLEKYNKYYLEDHYDVNIDNVMIVKGTEVTEGPELLDEFYGQMVNFAKDNDLSIQENYDKLCHKMDMQSFIDYICVNAYLCNMDVSENKNYMIWRTIETEDSNYGDTKWRWMLYDIDCLSWTHPEKYGVEKKSQIDSFSQIMEYTGVSLNSHPIFIAAKVNEEFCKQFVLSFMDMANTNFKVENVQEVFSKWDVSLEEYEGFFEERFNYIVPYMAEEFELTGTLEDVMLKVNDVHGGTIQLNTTTPNLSQGEWNGKYYTDYPITVTAIPADGYEFVGWTGSINSNSSKIEVKLPQGGMNLEACFVKR